MIWEPSRKILERIRECDTFDELMLLLRLSALGTDWDVAQIGSRSFIGYGILETGTGINAVRVWEDGDIRYTADAPFSSGDVLVGRVMFHDLKINGVHHGV